MRRAWWIIRIAVIIAAAYCVLAPSESGTLQNAQAQKTGCDTRTNCARNSSDSCYCPVVVIGGQGCNGCFVPNGSTSCGSCSAGP
jgi:hypothetical protein